MDRLVPNFSWVLTDRLAGCGLPARGDPDRRSEAYQALFDAGVRRVIRLVEQPPADRGAIIEAAGLEWVHFPINDFSTPRDVGAFLRLLDESHAAVLAGRPIVAHCWAGIGRTGMFLAAYLHRFGGHTADDAVRLVRMTRPGSVQTPGQAYIVGQADPSREG